MKILGIILLALLSFNSIAEDRYKMVASDGDSPFMWILDTKTGDVFSCLGSNDCVLMSNIKEVKGKSK